MAAAPETSAEYIKHHLTNLTFGQHPDGHWGFAHSMQEAAEMGFWAIHVDSMLWSVLLGAVLMYSFRKAAKVATSGEEARDRKFLRPFDKVEINRDQQLWTAKRMAISMAEEGYTPPMMKSVGPENNLR